MRLWILLVVLISFASQRQAIVRHSFGVRIGLTVDSQIVNFAGFIYNDGRLVTNQNLTKEDFIRFASGFWPSRFNPKRENFFEKYNVPGGLLTDSITGKKIPFCPTLDSLWKICYSDHPFRGSSEKGWSQELYKPSRKQFLYLDSVYGVKSISHDFFHDTMFWRLLQDIDTPNWKEHYMTIQ
jgi:hypothetical protein